MTEQSTSPLPTRERSPDVQELAEYTDDLTSLLTGMTKSELLEMRSTVEDKEGFATEVSSVLGEAFEQASDDPRLQANMNSITEVAVMDIARRQPQKLGDAIAPALGPAIRGMVSMALTDLNERVESVIQQSFSIQGLKWRIESARKGTPLSELVMRDTLTYRVEQVLLIHRSSGTLLNHALQPDYDSKDPAVVASMLTAVKQFLQEAFKDSASEALSHQFGAGDMSILIEASGELALAAVVRGTQTARLQRRINQTLEQLLGSMGAQANSFKGKIEEFAAASPLLEDCLVYEKAGSATKNESSEAKRKGSSAKWMLAAVAALGLAGWFGYQNYESQRNWKAFLVALEAEQGLAVTRTDFSGQESITISGLRDPDSASPEKIAQAFGYTSVDWQLKGYLSLEPGVILQRARRLMNPPSSINLRYADGQIVLSGRASQEWLDSIATLSLPGVSAINANAVLGPI